MQGNLIAIPIIVPGTLTADVVFRMVAPFGLQLVKVTAYTDNALTFILDIGTQADFDAYLDEVVPLIRGEEATLKKLMSLLFAEVTCGEIIGKPRSDSERHKWFRDAPNCDEFCGNIHLSLISP